MRVRCLSVHADYRCRHSGECCRAGWPIAVDDDLRRQIETGLPGVKLSSVLETSPCQFFEGETHLCALHRRLGPEYKPSSCRHFPRIALLDARGVSLTLSHYCPTAAALLFRDDVPLEIVETPSSFPPDDEYEGLDARDVLPPLLRPGMLWDLDGYSTFEASAVTLLGGRHATPEGALASLESIAADIERWSPAMGELAVHVKRSFQSHDQGRTAPLRSRWGDRAPVANRYLAARLFASWVPYRCVRLSTLVADLTRTHALLSEHATRADLLTAIRRTDFQVLHSAAGTRRAQC